MAWSTFSRAFHVTLRFHATRKLVSTQHGQVDFYSHDVDESIMDDVDGLTLASMGQLDQSKWLKRLKKSNPT